MSAPIYEKAKIAAARRFRLIERLQTIVIMLGATANTFVMLWAGVVIGAKLGLRPFLVVFIAVTVAWRVPPVMDALASHPVLVLPELITLLAAGTGLWLELGSSPPLSPRLPTPHRAAVAEPDTEIALRHGAKPADVTDRQWLVQPIPLAQIGNVLVGKLGSRLGRRGNEDCQGITRRQADRQEGQLRPGPPRPDG